MENKKPVLVDAVFINNGGGKILLDYLFQEVDRRKMWCHFLIDARLKQEYEKLGNKHIEIKIIDGFLERVSFYRNNRTEFQNVLCFGNIPPTRRLNAKTFTYFHQLIYLSIPPEFKLLDQLKFTVKIAILRLLRKNTDYWLVQNSFTRQALIGKFNLRAPKVLSVPFYPPLISMENYVRTANSFIFVSNANPHKNHRNLIEAFCQFYDQNKEGKLTVTVNENFPEICELIQEKVMSGYPIHNIGFISREKLSAEYRRHQYLIFPSLSESFGLGIVEAIENGCKIIGVDLSYTYEVCEPSIIIEKPHNVEKILKAMNESRDYGSIPFSKQKVYNEIEKLLNLLEN